MGILLLWVYCPICLWDVPYVYTHVRMISKCVWDDLLSHKCIILIDLIGMHASLQLFTAQNSCMCSMQ